MTRTANLIASLILFVLGLALVFAGNFAHRYVTDQLVQERITMPAAEATAKLPAEHRDALAPYLGSALDTGPEAQAYANHYIWAHMMASSEGKTYSEISGQFMALTRGANPDPAEVKRLGDLRMSLFMGDSLRSTLLTAYAFWLMGSIATWAGWAALAAGLLWLGLSLLRRPAHVVTPAPVAVTPRM